MSKATGRTFGHKQVQFTRVNDSRHNLTTTHLLHRGYYMTAWGYEFYLRVLKVSLTSERSGGKVLSKYFSTRR